MIEAIKEIGEYVLTKEDRDVNNPLDILIEDPESNPKYPSYRHILLINIRKINEDYEYTGVDHEEYSKSKIKSYLYKQGSPNGPDITPTSRITRIKPEKGKKSTFDMKILSWFKKYDRYGSDEEANFLVRIGECLRTNKEKIQADLEDVYENVSKKEKAVLTLKIDGKYLGDYEIFKTILVEESKKGFYSKYGVTSKADNKICSVCNDKKDEVYGFVDTFKFYTVDKPGFVSSGFRQGDAWKNYPVCLNCALVLEEGRKYLKNYLDFNFYGINYHLIPKFIFPSDYEDKKYLFSDLIEEWKDPTFEKKGAEINRITSDENEIFDLMSEQQNYLNMDFMFYDAPKGYDGSVFNILLYIEDVLPSRLRKIFESKKDIDKIDIFKECMIPVYDNRKKTGEKSLEFNFGVLRDFFYDYITKRWISQRYFLDIVSKVFTGRPIDYYFLLGFIMQRIRDDFADDIPTKTSTLKGFMLINFLNNLDLLRYEDGKEAYMEKKYDLLGLDTKDEIYQRTNSFFSEFSDFFDDDAKKAVFLEGVLTQFLLNIQYSERKATPFRTKLKGLKLDEREVKKLLPEIQNKLEEYGKNYYKPLERIISGYFISAGDDWKLTNDEINFYFVLGMNLSHLFKSKKDDESEYVGDEDDE
ncbi:MAG TPA: TIGR02556 family CRISPR-associated protein [Halobacteria archaeon]|nr:TIGR02556 family CRISPR-associated protein [Halobacteria archaeon]